MDDRIIRVSIIVPVFNAEKTLSRCIDSLISQSLKEKEIILADDVSSDGSEKIIDAYCEKYPDIVRKVKMSQNTKGSGVINKGVEVALGEFVMVVDNDDYLQPQALEKMIAVADKEQADVVDCYFRWVDEEENTLRIEEGNTKEQIGRIDDEKRKGLFVNPGRRLSKIIKRQLIIENELGYPENVCYGDNYFMELLMGYVSYIAKVEEPLYNYFVSTGSITRKYNNPITYDRVKSAELILEETKKRGFFEKYQEEIEFRFVELFYVNSVPVFLAKFKPAEINELKRLRKYIKDNFPRYRKNKYFRQRVTRLYRIISKLNDISPRLAIMAFGIINCGLVKKIVKARK
ncbi:MAG: glycosyltransferase family 2 protein [Lachnospiraceae bacterium]|nr:glycosyltransferase family 2 protein [Lachnospiraceae bacterium]